MTLDITLPFGGPSLVEVIGALVPNHWRAETLAVLGAFEASGAPYIRFSAGCVQLDVTRTEGGFEVRFRA